MKKLGVFLSAVLLTACANAELKGNQYVLEGSPKDMPITLSFDAVGNRFNGKAVNNYFGSYTTNGHQITFAQTGATMMMGAPAEMEAESQYFQDLTHVQSYQTDGNRLTLVLSDGKQLHFKKDSSPVTE